MRLVARDPYRTSINVENRHATQSAYIDTMPAAGITTANASIRIAPNESVQITLQEDGIVVTYEWAIVADGANTTVAVFEGHRLVE